jgi:hypothetical protein
VWANMLHNVYAELVVAKGFSDKAHRDPSGEEGNVIFLHLFMDALALQPCNPTFVTARECSAVCLHCLLSWFYQVTHGSKQTSTVTKAPIGAHCTLSREQTLSSFTDYDILCQMEGFC